MVDKMPRMTKLISWNVNGIRAAVGKGFLEWLAAQSADIVCIQETKATQDQLDFFVQTPSGYKSDWFSAVKPGYSGVATYFKTEPLAIYHGFSGSLVETKDFDPLIDQEGRVQTLEFKDFFLINAYFPNSQREHTRLKFKLNFCQAMEKYCSNLSKKKGVVLCGDYNIAHQEIDLKNPKSNMNNAGFLPEERAWMDGFLKKGFVDIFRKLEPSGGHYTWWSYRPGVREKNIGWRLDYHCISRDLESRVKSASHQPMVMGSDHCPVVLELRN
jgi:exodeoxyribonuclease III